MSVSALKVTKTNFSIENPKRQTELRLVDRAPLCDIDREALVMNHRARALSLARGMLAKWRASLEVVELCSLVDISLCEAAARFDAGAGASFFTFFYFYLKGNLVKAVVSRSDKRLVFVESYDLPIDGTELDSDCAKQRAEQSLERQQISHLAENICRSLKGLEHHVIWGTFFEHKTPGELTRETGMTRGHLSRVRKNALAKIRRKLEFACG